MDREYKNENDGNANKIEPSTYPVNCESAGVADVRQKFSTTSSIYAEHTLSNPANDQVVYCIGALIQSQIFDDSEATHLARDVYPEFYLDIQLMESVGGDMQKIPEQILNHETLNDNELRDKLLAGEVPTVDTIYRFISFIYLSAQYSSQCNIIALIYLNRITGKNKIALTMHNWRGLWVACVIMAQKVWDDNPCKTSSFTALLPGISKAQLRQIELQAFILLEYTALVKPSVYAKYYFELRSLFVDIVGADKRFDWNLKPLSIVQGKILEDRSSRAGEGARSSHKSTPSHSAASKVHTPYTPHCEAGEKMDRAEEKFAGAKTLEDMTFKSPSTRYVLS